jgi:hypothetical protein
MAPFSLEKEPPTIPGRFKPLLGKRGEAHLAKHFEGPMANGWFGDGPLSRPKQLVPGTPIRVPIDYKSFKLFHLSILWRMAMSKHQAYSDVTIEPVLLETLRLMLLDVNPGATNCFPMHIMPISLDGSACEGIIIRARRGILPHDGTPFIATSFGGCEVIFILSANQQDRVLRFGLPEPGKPLWLQPVDLMDAPLLGQFRLEQWRNTNGGSDTLVQLPTKHGVNLKIGDS